MMNMTNAGMAEDWPSPFEVGEHFNVPDIKDAVAKVTKGGGQVLNGPTEVPGGLWVIQCFDPQGAMFALVAPK